MQIQQLTQQMDDLLEANAKLAADNRDKDVRLGAYVKQYELMRSIRQSVTTNKQYDAASSQRNNDLDSFIAFQQKTGLQQFVATSIPRLTMARKQKHALSEITSIKLSVACSNAQYYQIQEEVSQKSIPGSYQYKDIEVKSNNSALMVSSEHAKSQKSLPKSERRETIKSQVIEVEVASQGGESQKSQVVCELQNTNSVETNNSKKIEIQIEQNYSNQAQSQVITKRIGKIEHLCLEKATSVDSLCSEKID